MILLQHYFLEHLDSASEAIRVLSTDFSKAFDSVRHDLLIKKLIKSGISGSLLRWIIDYLTNRTQIVKVKNSLSSEKQVTNGVIQG